MEKPSKIRISIFKYATFVNTTQQYSPTGRDRPVGVISIVPEAARSKKKNDPFHVREPISPKVSCIGQLKQEKQSKPRKKVLASPLGSPRKAAPSQIRNFFHCQVMPRRYSDAGVDLRKRVEATVASPTRQTSRFASGRDGLAGFDRRQKVSPHNVEEGPAVMGKKELNMKNPRTESKIAGEERGEYEEPWDGVPVILAFNFVEPGGRVIESPRPVTREEDFKHHDWS